MPLRRAAALLATAAALKDRSVGHRCCRGAGDHAWPYGGPELKDFVAYVYGTTPATPAACPNGWGAETP
nr:hypothetical protein OG409_08745 [Streptomyces sp. NBC_00974]